MTRGLVGSDSRSATDRVNCLLAYWGGSCDPTHSLAPPLAPSFEHEHVPYQVLPVAPSIEMVLPVLSNPSGIEQIGFAQASFIEKRLRPFAEGAAQPLGKRNAKSHLWTVNKVPRYMTVEDLSQQPLTLTTPNLGMAWQVPGEFDDPVIKQRNACLKGNGHAGAIDFG